MADSRITFDPALPVGSVAYGCWRFCDPSADPPRARIEAALDAGMTLIDTADIYGFPTPGFGAAEELLGRVLAEAPGLRDRMLLATKGGIRPPIPYDSSGAGLRSACEDSLRRLGVDVIDLFQVHRPDLLTHPAEVAEVLDSLIAEGKVRAVGVSNHTPAQTAALAGYLETPLVSDQVEFHPLREAPLMDGTLDAAMAARRLVLAWSPLAGGRLAAPVPEGARAAAVASVCDRIAKERGVTRAAILLAWCRRHPSGAVPIIGTQRVERIREAAAAGSITLDATEWYEILVAGRGEAMP